MDAAVLCVRFHGEFCLSEAAYAIAEKRKDGSFQKAFARTEDMRHARLGLRWKRARMKDVNEHRKDDYVKRGVRSCFPGRRKESGGRTCTPPACRSRGAFERAAVLSNMQSNPATCAVGAGRFFRRKNPFSKAKMAALQASYPKIRRAFAKTGRKDSGEGACSRPPKRQNDGVTEATPHCGAETVS